MHMYPDAENLQELINDAAVIVIVQADNPDADSLGSALALEQILGDMGKQPLLYCGVDMPGYLRYMSGWDRVERDLPQKFDASIIVDASTMSLLEKLTQSGQKSLLATKPCAVLDHHGSVENVIPFASIMINDPGRASAGELIYVLARQLSWSINVAAKEFIAGSILGDTQGLSNQLASHQTYHIMADLIEGGVDRPKLEELRREYGKMPQEIFSYKAVLIQHTEFARDGTIASVMVPQVEINQYSPLYNPGPLIQGDMLQTVGVQVAIVFKRYDDGKITGAIRCNPGYGIAADLATKFGGGGHAYASGFKMITSRPFTDIRSECIDYADQLLTTLEQ
jgi:phosphoesterase RecJ-like protein